MKFAHVLGLAPETGKEICCVCSHKHKPTMIKAMLHGRCMAAAFESPFELVAWVGGADVLKKYVAKDGSILWITDKIRRCNDKRGSWWEPAGTWIGYRWIINDPMVVAILNARTEELLKKKGQKNK